MVAPLGPVTQTKRPCSAGRRPRSPVAQPAMIDQFRRLIVNFPASTPLPVPVI